MVEHDSLQHRSQGPDTDNSRSWAKARELQRAYVAECFKKNIPCDVADVNGTWLTDWTEEFRVSFRKPTKKYKVPDWVLEQRLQIFWESLIRVRRAAELCLGYDLQMDNVDQSPFHKNEAGSKDKCTLSI